MKSHPIDMRRHWLRKFLPSLSAICAGVLCMGAGIGAASANPSGESIIYGQVTFSRQGNVFTITNSPNAIINWTSFSISAGEMTRFIQQSSSSSVLNRITGQDPSQILGALQSNGRVFLINPNGIVFGAGSQVNVAGLVASTLNISNADFLAGKNNFAAGNIAGNVANQGTITTPSGGQVFLIAPNVTNTGIITSPEGEVLLAAGHSVQLADSTNPSLHVVVSSPTDQAINLGQIIAQGGKIGIYGALVNQRGMLNANSATVGANGKIVLRATRTTLLEAGSVTTATSIDGGGEIQALGEQVGLMGDAHVDASGQNGGGTVLIGGDYQGANAAVMNAQQVYIDKDATIAADAIVRGNGGKVIVWGDATAQAYGSISVRGGAQSGDGGFVETSGHFLDIAGLRVNAGAAHGKAGKWLLDPYDITIDSFSTDELSTSKVLAFEHNIGAPDAASTIDQAQISNSNANVTLQARNNIDFKIAIEIIAPGVGLTAQAGNNINVGAPIVTHGGALLLSANDNGGGTASGAGVVIIQPDGALTTNGGALTTRGFVAAPTPPPSANICTVAPNSALCQILSPSTASEPVKPVQQASNEVIKTVTTSTPKTDFDQVAFLDTKKNATATGGGTTGGAAATSTPDDSKTADKAADKTDTKEVASNDKSGTKNEPAPKMFCN